MEKNYRKEEKSVQRLEKNTVCVSGILQNQELGSFFFYMCLFRSMKNECEYVVHVTGQRLKVAACIHHVDPMDWTRAVRFGGAPLPAEPSGWS